MEKSIKPHQLGSGFSRSPQKLDLAGRSSLEKKRVGRPLAAQARQSRAAGAAKRGGGALGRRRRRLQVVPGVGRGRGMEVTDGRPLAASGQVAAADGELWETVAHGGVSGRDRPGTGGGWPGRGGRARARMDRRAGGGGWPAGSDLHERDQEGIPVMALVDVRDVAQAHVLVYENPAASGRYFCIGTVVHQKEFLRMPSEIFPEYPITTKCEDEINPMVKPYKFSNQKLKDLGLDRVYSNQEKPVRNCE
ncbi:hypothetical protein J5N97_023876 [Dioscorea zingiberensis]|uniref:Cinnamoyl-CoA reductase 1-like n=1 Tax=Dioscorea zingiberensis TaxID=325984 RepID=A0A9D5C6F0_9LILI|nr:hypothetical protein J5N97_023876 [Dioscorea zingiberensis]